MKITRIETIHLAEYANILFVRVHTDAGHVGLGETSFTPESTRAYIHEFGAPMLLGHNPLDIEGHWRRLYDSSHAYGNRGNEMRAISALEVALWDILGKHANLPLYRLLGGASREKVQIYNTCAGPLYGRVIPGLTPLDPVQQTTGPYEDLDAFLHRADELARDLLSEGIRAMKIWPFDAYALQTGGTYISFPDLEKDVTWTGGIGESRKIAALADTHNLPFAAHDCTGPITLLASIHLSIHCPNALIQETVRAFCRGFYRDLITTQPRLQDGYAYPPEEPGIGAELRPEILQRPDATVREST